MTVLSLREIAMRWPGIVLIAACSLSSGVVVGRFTATPAPVPDEFEIKSAGSNNHAVIKVNKRTGQTWVKNLHGNWTPMQ